MSRRRHNRRRVLPISSDSEDEPAPLVKPLIMDKKVALMMDDLGKSSRDRLTTHDTSERTRRPDQEAIENFRRSNQKGTAEAENARTHATKLTAWNNPKNIPGAISTLDDIAGGQYHRSKLTELVSNERHDISKSHAHSDISGSRRGGGLASRFPDRGRGRNTTHVELTQRNRPLDPAVDSSRLYKYKSGPQYSGQDDPRQSSSTHTSTHSAVRKPIVNPFNNPATGQPSARAKDGRPRAGSKGKRVQDRPWPPAALAEFMTRGDTASAGDNERSTHAAVIAQQIVAQAESAPNVTASPIVHSRAELLKKALDPGSFIQYMNSVAVTSGTPSAAASTIANPFKQEDDIQTETAIEVDAQPLIIVRDELRRNDHSSGSSPDDDFTDGVETPGVQSGPSPDLTEGTADGSQTNVIGLNIVGVDMPNLAVTVKSAEDGQVGELESTIKDPSPGQIVFDNSPGSSSLDNGPGMNWIKDRYWFAAPLGWEPGMPLPQGFWNEHLTFDYKENFTQTDATTGITLSADQAIQVDLPIQSDDVTSKPVAIPQSQTPVDAFPNVSSNIHIKADEQDVIAPGISKAQVVAPTSHKQVESALSDSKVIRPYKARDVKHDLASSRHAPKPDDFVENSFSTRRISNSDARGIGFDITDDIPMVDSRARVEPPTAGTLPGVTPRPRLRFESNAIVPAQTRTVSGLFTSNHLWRDHRRSDSDDSEL